MERLAAGTRWRRAFASTRSSFAWWSCLVEAFVVSRARKGKATQKARREARTLEVVLTSPRWLVGTVARQGTTKKSAARDLQTRRRKGKGTASTKEKTRAKARVQRTTRTTSLRQRAKASVAKERGRTRSSKRALWLRVKRRKSLKVRR